MLPLDCQAWLTVKAWNSKERTIKGGVPSGNFGSLERFSLDWIVRIEDVQNGGRVIELSHDCYIDGDPTTSFLQLRNYSGDPQFTVAVHCSFPTPYFAGNLRQNIQLPIPTTSVVSRSTAVRVP